MKSTADVKVRFPAVFVCVCVCVCALVRLRVCACALHGEKANITCTAPTAKQTKGDVLSVVIHITKADGDLLTELE
jgi:hypothetical protein